MCPIIAYSVRSRGKQSNRVAGQSSPAIRAAALDLCAILGFEGASKQQITADVDASLISYHLGSMPGLSKAIVAYAGQALTKAQEGTADAVEVSAEGEIFRDALSDFLIPALSRND